MRIIGVSCFYHDSAATYIENGKVQIAIQEERFSRIKNDSAFPQQCLNYILQKTQLKLEDFDAIVYYEKPWLKFDRLLETYIASAPLGLKYFVKSFPLWIKQKLFLKQELCSQLKNFDPEFNVKKLLFSEHHLSHAASAYYPSPFMEALVVTFDGAGEWVTASVGRGLGNHLEILEEMHFPDSLGLFYSAITAYCGFKVNSGEYKVMGLAPYGTPRFYDLWIKELVELKSDGAWSLNFKYFDFLSGSKMHTSSFEKLMGEPARTPESQLTPFYMDVAASLQKVFEKVLEHVLAHFKDKYKMENLCLAGGVALNCVANSQIKNKLFKNIWVQPAAGDAGGSWGAALAAHFLHFKNTEREALKESPRGLYLGPLYLQEEIESACEAKNLVYKKLSQEELVDKVVLELARGSAVGWFQGGMEFGPRALGARSILADARVIDMQKRLNIKIKFRESFRPFAPVLLIEDASLYFEGGEASSYMMFVDTLKKSWQKGEPEEVQKSFGLERLNFSRSDFPAITHLDYSARLQTVDSTENPLLHAVLTKFKEQTGSGILVNTSFNVRGEPIVCTPIDAINGFKVMDIDVLFMENICVFKKDNSFQIQNLRSFNSD